MVGIHTVLLFHSQLEITSRGSLPGLRTGAKPIPNSKATGQPTIKPRASGPTIMSIFLFCRILNNLTNSVTISISVCHQRTDITECHAFLWIIFDLLQCSPLNSWYTFFQKFLLSIISLFHPNGNRKLTFYWYLLPNPKKSCWSHS